MPGRQQQRRRSLSYQIRASIARPFVDSDFSPVCTVIPGTVILGLCAVRARRSGGGGEGSLPANWVVNCAMRMPRRRTAALGRGAAVAPFWWDTFRRRPVRGVLLLGVRFGWRGHGRDGEVETGKWEEGGYQVATMTRLLLLQSGAA